MATTSLEIANQALSKIGSRAITSLTQAGSNEAVAINLIYDDILDEVLSEHPWTFAQKRISLVPTVPADPSRTIDDSVYTPVVISAATAADPVVITAAGHGLSDGDWIKISGVVGMTQLNGNFYIVANATGSTFSLKDTDGNDVDGSAFTAYSSAGQIQKADEMVTTESFVPVVYEKPSDYVKLTKKNICTARIDVERDKIISDTENLKIKYTFRNTDVSQYYPKFIQALVCRLSAEIAFTITNSSKKATDLLNLYHNTYLPMAISNDSTQGSPDEPLQDEWLNAMTHGSSGSYATTGETWHPL